MNAGLNLVRFFLASNVVLFHLWNAAAPGAGPVAVLGFFFTSGFLITQIVQEVYAMPQRAWAFLLNRSLRIYPQYLAALALGLLAISLYPAVAYHINTYLRWPRNAAEWLPQLAIFGLIDSHVRVLPATWTLGTELYFYLLIGLVTARSRGASAALCLVSLPVGALCALKILPFEFYGSPIGNGFVFALGSLAYFYRDAIRIRPRIFMLACAAYLAHAYLVPALEQTDLDTANLAGSVLPFAVILLYLVQHQVGRHTWTARIANVLGKIAYPMFLLHWAVCVVVSAWLFHGLASFDMHGLREGAQYFAAMFAGVLVCSLLFYVLIDQPVERYRQLVRRRARRPGAAPVAAGSGS
ncbi:MAG: Acyltransferase family protein [Ramlibacter sp.]|nr:Acyltransferase family protein [Ramlibacter sp.]